MKKYVAINSFVCYLKPDWKSMILEGAPTRGRNSASLLPIDECEEWIWHILDCTDDCGFEYICDDDKEILIFNTNDFFADMKALQKIRKITGMALVQMSTHNCHTQLWFARSFASSHHINRD